MPRSAVLLLHLALILLLASTSATFAQPREVKPQTSWVFEADAAHPGSTFRAALRVRLDDHFHVQSNQPADEYSVPTELAFNLPAGISLKQLVFPVAKPFQVEGFDEPLLVFDSEFVIGIALQIGDDLALGTYQIQGELTYQACDNKICLMPTTAPVKIEIKVVAPDAPITATNDAVFSELDFSHAVTPPTPPDPAPPKSSGGSDSTAPLGDCDVLGELEHFTVLGSAGGYMGVDDFIAFIDAAESGTASQEMFEGMGPIAIVAVVIVGGILLNLTPCVLPLIPINLAIIGAGAQAGSRTRGFALGGTYGLAMAVVYGALGLVVILTSTAFGTINSTIWFNVAIAILFVFLALAMFDVIAIDFTKYQAKLDATKVAQRGTFALAFFMGCVTALLAGACVAPVVIQVVVYAGDQYARGETIALALPFFLGLGMALPWPFAGAGLSFLPKPGMWMVRVKQAMGVFILAFAAYYAYLAYGIWRIDSIASKGDPTVQLEGGWSADLCAALRQARAENKPVFIDMWATWCKNCLAMDRTTFKDQRVIERLDGFVKVKHQAQKIDVTPNQEMLTRFDQIGLPAYAVLRPNAASK